MKMVAKIANMKIANPKRTRTMIEGGQGYEIDGKLCYLVPDNALRIKETEVYVAFMDRFYTPESFKMVAQSECSPLPEAPRLLGSSCDRAYSPLLIPACIAMALNTGSICWLRQGAVNPKL